MLQFNSIILVSFVVAAVSIVRPNKVKAKVVNVLIMSKALCTSWIKPYPELVLDGDRVFCKPCSKVVSCSKKFQIDQHIKTPSHIAKVNKMKSGPIQSTLKQSFEAFKNENHSQSEFNEDLCKTFLAANIPLNKLTNPQVKTFLQKYSKFNPPDESTLRKNVVGKVFATVLDEIKHEIGGNSMYIVVDETSDACGRYIVNLMIGKLTEDEPGKAYLIAVKEVEKTNNLTVTRFIQETLTHFFLPNPVPTEKILVLLSDAAPYMIKAGQNLKIFYENLIHVTCLAHGLNRVAETIRVSFPLVNDLISNVKKIFIKAPLRVQFYKANLPGVPLPPEPVVTRWGTWIRAAIFYADNFQKLKDLISQMSDDSQCIQKCKEIFQNVKVEQQLIYIKCNYVFLADSILQLEESCKSLTESMGIIETCVQHCKQIRGEVGKTVVAKLESIIEKNTGFKILRQVVNIMSGKTVNNFAIDPFLVPKLTFCPITSVDVERSFSLYKHVLSDRRHNFLIQNLEAHIITSAFYNFSN